MSVKTNFWIDLAVFVGFLVALEPNMTGILIHEWFTLSLAGMLIVHFILHWDWFMKLTVRFFENLYHSSRLNYLLAILIFCGFITIITSGLIISEEVMPLFGVENLDSRGWYKIHELASNLSLLLVAVHVAIRWEWVKTTITRLFVNPWLNRKNQTVSLKDEKGSQIR